jgi:hypothetical protein
MAWLAAAATTNGVQAGRIVVAHGFDKRLLRGGRNKLFPCFHVVFFVLNAYYPKIGKKGGCPDTPPFFPKFRTPFSRFRTKGGLVRRLGTDLGFPNIFKFGYLCV